MPANDLSPESIRKDFNLTPPPAPVPAAQPQLIRTLGEALVLLTATGLRLDEAMGVVEYRRIQSRLILAGLLKEDGEPTSRGDAAAKQFIEARKLMQATAAQQPNPQGN